MFSRTWLIYLCVYGFPVMWINFPKYWTECCSPSSFLVETLWSLKTMLLIKSPKIWVSMRAITFCLCVLWKACITWHFWATNRKLTFSWKITPQGAIPPLNVIRWYPQQSSCWFVILLTAACLMDSLVTGALNKEILSVIYLLVHINCLVLDCGISSCFSNGDTAVFPKPSI